MYSSLVGDKRLALHPLPPNCITVPKDDATTAANLCQHELLDFATNKKERGANILHMRKGTR